jgi:NitT/TauT family transport system substrate-binding protein
VRLVYVAQSAIFGPVWVARDAGYFARYGLDVEIANIPGATRLQQAVLAGEVDYAVAAGTPAIAATVSGAPSPLLAEFIDLPVWFLVVRPDVARIADLRGKRVGITQFGAGTDFVLRAALRDWGFEPDRDVTILQMGGTQEIFAGLAGGAIDAGPMAAPLHLRAAREGYPPLLDLADTGIHYPQMVLTATRGFLAGRDAQAASVLRALVEANYRYKRDNALALEVLTRYTGDTDPEQLQAAWASATKVLKNVPRVS